MKYTPSLFFFTVTVFVTLFIESKCQSQNYIPFVYDNSSLFLFTDTIESLREEPAAIIDPRGYAIQLQRGWSHSGGCDPHDAMTWAGPKFVNGSIPNTYYFFNKNNEPITFKPTLNVGEKWTMYTYGNGNYIEATISNKVQLNFLQLTDSVKSITLQLKTASGTELTSPVNSIVYKLSKNYGLIQLTRFLDFPTATKTGILIGLSSPAKGIQPITSREIFNYDIGDEFHYDSLIENGNTYINTEIKTIHKVIGIYHSSNTDTVIYTLEQQVEKHTINTQTLVESYEYTSGNIQEKHLLSSTLLYPGQANLGAQPFLNNAAYSLTLFADDTTRSLWSCNGDYFYPDSYSSPSCWTQLAYDPIHSYQYLEGCGLYHDHQYTWYNVTSDKQLVYFKKGDQTWGQELVITSTKEAHGISFTLYPNPLKKGEILHFYSNHFKADQIMIFDAHGNKVFEWLNDIESIDLTTLHTGLYLVQLINEQQEQISCKLLIR